MEKEKNEKRKKTICESILSKDNLVRDILIISLTLGFSIFMIADNIELLLNPHKETSKPVAQENIVIKEKILETGNPIIETTDWISYQNNWYGFELKYPPNWGKPTSKSAAGGVK